MNWNFWETDDYSYPYLSSEQNWQQIKSDLLLAEKEQLLEFYTRLQQTSGLEVEATYFKEKIVSFLDYYLKN